MEELDIYIKELENKENDLLCAITKPTDYGRCPPVSELLALSEPVSELGKVIYAIGVFKELKKNIEFNRKYTPTGRE